MDGVAPPDGQEAAAARSARRARAARRAGEAPASQQGRALVHVGFNKAGSSTIQAWLDWNRGALRRQGVVYSLFQRPKSAELGQLYGLYAVVYGQSNAWTRDRKLVSRFQITSPEAMAERVARFTERAEHAFAREGASLHVFSSELIGARLTSVDQIRALDQWLCARVGRVEYAVYLRDQVDWVPSAYAESITQGGTRTLDDFIGVHGLVDYNAFARRWARAVGPDRLHVRLLEPGALAGGDLVDDFAALIGVDGSGLRRPPRVNEALPARRLRVLRRANLMGNVLSERLGARAAKPALARMTAAFDWGPKLRLTDAQAARVAALNAPANEALRAWLFPARPALFTRSGRILAQGDPATPSG